MAIMGIAAALGGLLATAVALTQLVRHGVNIGPVLLGNGLPLAIFVAAVILGTRRMLQGGRGAAILYAGFALSALTWWILNG